MMAVAERFEELKQMAAPTNWRGRSGRFYGLAETRLAAFSLVGDDLYVLVARGRVLFVGGAQEVVADPALRANFRAALRQAELVYRTDAPADPVERLTAIWDLERAEPAAGLRLA